MPNVMRQHGDHVSIVLLILLQSVSDPRVYLEYVSCSSLPTATRQVERRANRVATHPKKLILIPNKAKYIESIIGYNYKWFRVFVCAMVHQNRCGGNKGPCMGFRHVYKGRSLGNNEEIISSVVATPLACATDPDHRTAG